MPIAAVAIGRYLVSLFLVSYLSSKEQLLMSSSGSSDNSTRSSNLRLFGWLFWNLELSTRMLVETRRLGNSTMENVGGGFGGSGGGVSSGRFCEMVVSVELVFGEAI